MRSSPLTANRKIAKEALWQVCSAYRRRMDSRADRLRPLDLPGARSLIRVLRSAMAVVHRVGGVPLSPTYHDVCGASSGSPLTMVAKMEVAEAFYYSSDKDC
jgi:hypothetical protein